MSKLLSINSNKIIVLFLLLSSLGTPLLAENYSEIKRSTFIEECSNNILINPDFEDGLNNWTATGATLISDNAYSGSFSASICEGSGSIGKALPTTAGTSYNASLWIRWSELGNYAQVRLRFLDNNYSPIDSNSDGINGFTYQEYTQIELSATAPVNAAYVHIYIYKSNGGCLLIDDVELCESNIIEECSNNILINPDFEGGLVNWTTMGETLVSDNAYSGNLAASICNASGSIGKALPTTEGSSYNASLWVKWSEIGTFAQVRLRFLDNNYSPINSNSDGVNGLIYQEYTQVELSATAPANAAYVHVYIYKSNGGCLLIDDVELCETNDTNDPCNPDLTGPVFSNCPSNIQLTTTDSGRFVDWLNPTVDDACSFITFYADYQSGDFFPIGSTTVTYTGVDQAGNRSYCSFIITISAEEIDLCENNLLANPSFESSTTPLSNWSTQGEVSIISEANSGEHAIEISGFELGSISQSFLAEAGQEYTIGAYANLQADHLVEADLRVIFYSATWQPVGFYGSISINERVDYNYYSRSAIAPEGSYYVLAYIVKSEGYGFLQVDDICLTKKDALENCDPSNDKTEYYRCPDDITIYTTSNLTPVYYSLLYQSCPGSTIQSSHGVGEEFPLGSTDVIYTSTSSSGITNSCIFTVTVVRIDPVDCSNNLISNSGFENLLTDWEHSSFASESLDSYADTYAAKLEGGNATISQTMAAQEGDIFTASAYLKQTGSYAEMTGLVFLFLDEQMEVVGINKTANKNVNSFSPEYNPIFLQATAPANTAYLKVGVQKATGASKLFIDDFCLNKISSTTSPVDCEASSDFPWQEWISRVTLESIDNSSNKTPYSDFTSGQVAFFEPGQSYALEIDATFSYFAEDQYFSIYIDFNGDGFFSADELTQASLTNLSDGNGITHTLQTQINVPLTAAASTMTIRIIMQRGSYATSPCGVISFGEIEDYTAVIPSTTLNRIQETKPLRLFPNPAQNYVSINVEEYLSEKIELIIVNNLGQQMLYKEIARVSKSLEMIDLSNWKNGSYTVWISPQNKPRRMAQLFVIQAY